MSGQLFSDEDWGNLYLLLRPRVAHWMHTSRIPLWTQQRNEIIEDIVQDAILKTLAYAQRAERGEAREIDSLERISVVTAYHCYIDAHRREQGVPPLMQEYEEPAEASITWVNGDLSEQAIDNIYRAIAALLPMPISIYELIFIQAAYWIVNFPDKQRTGLLIGLANRMYFDPFHPTLLQQAFAAVDTSLQGYQRTLPESTEVCVRYASQVSMVYKRLALLSYLQQYMLICASHKTDGPIEQESAENESKEMCYVGR